MTLNLRDGNRISMSIIIKKKKIEVNRKKHFKINPLLKCISFDIIRIHMTNHFKVYSEWSYWLCISSILCEGRRSIAERKGRDNCARVFIDETETSSV